MSNENLIVYILAEKLLKPYKKWKLFEDKAIDEKGKIKDISKVSKLDHFVLKLKRMVNETVLQSFITFMDKKDEKQLTREYIFEQHESGLKKKKVEKQFNDLLLKENMTKDEFFGYLLENLKYEQEEAEKQSIEKLKGGLGDGKKLEDFDPIEVIKGLRVEREHTNDFDVMSEIVCDHLTENERYYSDFEEAGLE
jgi:precorrin-6B methylase 1